MIFKLTIIMAVIVGLIWPDTALADGMETSEKPTVSIVKKGADEETQEKIDYAWKVSGNDKTFIYLLEAENSAWDEDTQSRIGYRRRDKVAKKRKKFYDYGICQISNFYHPTITNDERFYDWKWQIEQCRIKYKGGTRFYGLNNVNKVKGRFYLDFQD